ncbi:MAG: type II toxin-antitoxin system Phd/YefM family antitoxin [bacterium]|nr:type II toxin-antitoxin system Phd/YefM family antitoxin [bacterium]MCY3891157.1 type II toxin-antitoxin system Phd/YefM family antitoxin [bacterium]MCY3961916.1 type II toxin-antitoxin system Phd/YefM family antitoxin [bacterium]MCY4134254.1 type II toxin-antitoxin system Phd/YefM family antitoxin [bacterium]
MAAKQRTIAAGEFKNRCLALMDEVNETGEELVITKHGKPVSRLVPAENPKPQMWGRYKDQIRIVGDIMSPAVPLEDWEVISNPDRVLNPDLPLKE